MDFDKPSSSLRSLSDSHVAQRNTTIKRKCVDCSWKLRKRKGSTEIQQETISRTKNSDKIKKLKNEEWEDKCNEGEFKLQSVRSSSLPHSRMTAGKYFERKSEGRRQVNSKRTANKESEMNNCHMKKKRSLVTAKSEVNEQIPNITLAKRMKFNVAEEVVKPLTSSESKSYDTVSKLVLTKNEEGHINKGLNQVKPATSEISSTKRFARLTATPKTKSGISSIIDMSPIISKVIHEVNERNKIISNYLTPFKERRQHSRHKSIPEKDSDKNVFYIDEFVILKSDKDKMYPPIWKICSPSALEKFCPVYRQGRFRYRSLNKFKNCLDDDVNDYQRAPGSIWWRSHPKQIIEFKRDDIVVREEDIREKTYITNKKYMYNFLIYIQTLISQALIPKFTIEVYLHQDEYFSPAEVIININEKYKDRLLYLADWNSSLKDMLKLRPIFLNVSDVTTYDRLCVACGRLEATIEIILGNHNKWINTKRKGKDSILPKIYPLCATCAWLFDLWKELSHFTPTMFLLCVKKVCEKSVNTPLTEVEKLVEEILNDETWCDGLFRSACRVWAKVDMLEIQKSKLKVFL